MSNQPLILPDGHSEIWFEGEDLCTNWIDGYHLIAILSSKGWTGEDYRKIPFDREAKSRAAALINVLAHLIDSSPKPTQITMTFQTSTENLAFLDRDLDFDSEACNGCK